MWLNCPIGEIGEITGETMALSAIISGEITVNDVPLASWADLQALKAADSNPLEVVVEVPVGKSKRGWNYTANALQSIVGEVMATGLPGFKGHQKPENVNSEFPDPVTHWVGAKFDPDVENKDNGGKVISKGAAYFRGVVDKAADDLKRWINSKVIRQVSIYGIPKLKKVAGETQVVDYKPLSIDWTPLNRPGMPTRIVAMGEMDEIVIDELKGSHEELREKLREAAVALFNDDGYTWVYRVYDDHVVVEHDLKGITTYHSVPYAIVDGTTELGEKTEVEKEETFKPVGEVHTGKGDGRNMNWRELVAQLNAMLKSGDVTMGQVAGEMGLDIKTVAGEIDSAWLEEITGTLEGMNKIKELLGVTGEMDVVSAVEKMNQTLKEVNIALGVSGEMDVISVAKEATKAVGEQNRAKHDAMIDEVLNEKKVSGEMAQGLIKKMLRVPEDATKEQIAGEIDGLLADEQIKASISKLYTDKPAVVGRSKGGDNHSKNLRAKRSSI